MVESVLTDDRTPERDHRLKKCNQCGRTFGRTEHLQRHQRIHTQESPFSCPHCQRSFQRSDVLHRHATKHCAFRTLGSVESDDRTRLHRARVACDFCHRKKLRCCGGCPCSACKKGNRGCSYTRGKAYKPLEDRMNKTSPITQHSPALPTIYSTAEIPLGSSCDDTTAVQALLTMVTGDMACVPPASPDSPGEEQQDATICTSLFQANSNEASTTGSHSTWQGTLAIDISGSLDSAVSSQAPVSGPWHSEGKSDTTMVNASEIMSLSQLTSVPETSDYRATDPWNSGLFDEFPAFDNSFSTEFPLYYSLFFPESLEMEHSFHNLLGEHDPHQRSPDSQDAYMESAQAKLAMLRQHTRAFPKKDATGWMTTIPSFEKFDRDIINYFLTAFMKHIAPTFTSFLGFQVDEGTTSEKILAMAAVGGLFCKTSGGFTMARSMCSDARRLLFAQVDSDLPEREEHRLSMVQAYISVEIFGICSGDKRLYECAEAFHMHLLDILSRCRAVVKTKNLNQAWQKVVNDLYILESYRTVLFQRTPKLYLGSAFSKTFSLTQSLPRNLADRQWGGTNLLVRQLMNPVDPLVSLETREDSIHTLVVLLAFSWHAMPIRLGSVAYNTLWKRQYFELALSRWLKSHKTVVEDSTMLLFHMGAIALHTNMEYIHTLLHRFLQRPILFSVTEGIKDWCASEHCDIAVLHAITCKKCENLHTPLFVYI
ncbi:hypothetical protein F5884DRAFT_805117 [Xylogone sp. PMI_703]|nr:hypothetical protein F5884DRAFT_805117 [Xylogone sp. PMI_703]